jgi:hypothetical protein
METLKVDLVGDDEIPAAKAVINRDEEFSHLSPNEKLLAHLLAQATDDLDVALGARGRLTPLSDDERLHAASAAYFFLKGAARGYMRLLGTESALPMMQDKAILVIGALGGAWAHLSKLEGKTIDRRMAGVMSTSRVKAGLARMPVPASKKTSLTMREVASLI